MATDKVYPKELQELFDKVNKMSVGSLLFQAKTMLKRARQLLRQYDTKQNNDWCDELEEYVTSLQVILQERKKQFLARENQGPAEIELPTVSTSADAGKVS